MQATPAALTHEQAVLQAVGLRGLASVTRDLTDAEMRLVDDWFAQAERMGDAEFARYARLPLPEAAELRNLLAEDPR